MRIAFADRARSTLPRLVGGQGAPDGYVSGTMYAFSLPTKADKAAGLEWIHEINTTATAC
jgi:hypothetical protein